MEALRTACFLVYLLTARIVPGSFSDNTRTDMNMENVPLIDSEDLFNQFEMLNSAVKRQSKGSCSCTCETKQISDSSKQDADRTDSDTKQRLEPVSILRTGGLSGVAARLGKQAGQHGNADKGKNGGHGSSKPSSHRVTGSHNFADQSDENSQYPSDEMDRMWSHHRGRGHQPDEMQQDEPWRIPHDKHDKDKGSSGGVKSTGISVSDASWGHESRFPWKNLPTHMCFRESCERDSDCCLKFNLCDRSARICVDCWHHSSCITEAQCCEKYPYCKRDSSTLDSEQSGRCVKSL